MGILIFDWLMLWVSGIVPDMPNLYPFWQLIQKNPLHLALAVNALLGLGMCGIWLFLFLIGSRTDEITQYPITTPEQRAELERWERMDDRWAKIEICYAIFGIVGLFLIRYLDKRELL